MVQVSERPPPYSTEYPSFPPPIPGDVDNRAWAFQRAFEGAREIVRYSVLYTFKAWETRWRLQGQEIPREHVQLAYTYAPEELKMAVEWQLRTDTAARITSDVDRRCHEYFRKADLGIDQELLSPLSFEKEFWASKPLVQRTILSSISRWEDNGGMQVEPRPGNIKHEYESASTALKRVMCFTLELAWDSPQLPITSTRGLDAVKLGYQHLVASHRAEARAWDSQGRAQGFW